ncbi:MAG TPA: hypothetical protein DCK99_02670 [Blastocatellia bacterium]|nr:hypothetical protein [Blastocatellia bacterium]
MTFSLVLVALMLCLLVWQSARMQTPLRRITNTSEEGISINPSISGDGRVAAFESTEDIAGAGGNESFRAIRANVSVDPPTFLQMGATRAAAPAVSQDGSRIAFASRDNPLGTNNDGNSEIFLHDGARLIQVTKTLPGDITERVANGNFQPSISDDGRFIAFSSNRDLTNQNSDGNFEIFIYDTVAFSLTQLTNSSGTVGFTDAKISGNGSVIAYINDQGVIPSTKRDLLLQNRLELSPVRVLAANADLLSLTFGRAISDDGTRVLWTAQTATNSSQVFLYDGRNNITRQITSLGARVTDVALQPTISGNGSRVAFATRRTVIPPASDGGVDLYAYDIPSATFARVTNAPASATAEVVSSLSDDGSVIAFNFPRVLTGVSNQDFANNSEIYVTATTAPPAFGTLAVLNGASFGHEPSAIRSVATDSIAVARGNELAKITEQSQPLPDGTFPLTVGGTTVAVNERRAQIFYVSPTQVNFLVPPATEIGTAEVIVTNSDSFPSRGNVQALRAAPGVFTYGGDGLGEGVILNAETLQRGPFDPSSGNLRLIVFSTGARNGSQLSLTAGGRALVVESIIKSPTIPGLDEVHVLVPADLRSAGIVDLVITADTIDSNPVTMTFAGDARRDIVVNEFLADPPDGITGDANHDGVRSAGDDEFVELANSTNHDIAIGGYQILTRSGAGTSDALRQTFVAGTILPACSAIVVFGGGGPAFDPANAAFGGAQVLKSSSGSLSLLNSAGVITLRDQNAAIVNLVSYGGSTGFKADANQSLTRSPDITGNFTLHLAASDGARSFSPGTRVNGGPFVTCSPVTRVEVSPASATIAPVGQQQFSARALDENGQELSGVIFTWKSSDTSVASINSNGLATALASGATDITATARGVHSPPIVLTVRQVLTRIDVTPLNASIPAGGTEQFTARAFDQNNNAMAGVTFAWDSMNPTAANVNQAGLAMGQNVGETSITASAQGVTGFALLSVTGPTIVFNEVLADPPGGASDLVGDANHDGVRSSNDDEFVEFVNLTGAAIDLSGWTVRTHATGSATETTRHTFATRSNLPASEAIVIFGGGTFDPANPVFGCARIVKASSGGLSLTNSGLTVVLRDASGNLVVQFSYGGTSGLDGDNDQSLTRSPDNTGDFVQHIGAAGANGRKFSPGLKVDGTPLGPCPGHLTSITISPVSASVATGESTHFTAQAFDEYGRPLSETTIEFASDNNAVAIIDSVITNSAGGSAVAAITGQGAGTAVITAAADAGITRVISNQATLSVTPRVTRVEVSPARADINRGNTQQFTATAFDQNNQPLTGIAFTWSSGNANVAIVNANGLATGLGIGQVAITATTADGTGATISGTVALAVRVPLVINEILADPAGSTSADLAGDSNRDGVRDSDDDEFVELLNNSSDAVNISGVVIADSASNRFTFPANTTLAAGRAVVIFGGGSPPINDPAFGGALIVTTSTLSLSNTGDTVTAKLPVAGADVVIDSHAYGAEGGSDHSLTRSPDAEVGSAGGSFVAHTSATNAAGRLFSPGTRADGTPFGSPLITRIAILPDTAAVNIGAAQSFTSHAYSDAGGSEVEVFNVCFIWDSSDTTKATVVPNTGAATTATAIAAGNSIIRARAGALQGTAMLTVNPPPPTLTIDDVTQNEGNNGPATFTFTVTLSAAAPAGGVSFDIATHDDTATVGDGDYVARTLTAQTVPAGSQTYNFDVTVNGDLKIEPNETFFVDVTNVTGANIGRAHALAMIQNDDNPPTPALSVSDVSQNEGNNGTSTFTFTVSLSIPALAGGVTFDISTTDATAHDHDPATEDNDYLPRSLATQTIPEGTQTYTFNVTVNGDTLVEPDETFFVNVTNVSGANVADSQGQGTIQNDDTPLLVISQIYGGGGNTSATYQNDFIEIFNRGTTTVDFSVTPYSVQYAAATSAFSTNKTDITAGVVEPGQYFLIREASGGAAGSALPTPDATGNINLAATAGKVALVVGTTLFNSATCPGDDGISPFNPNVAAIADFVGYGSTANCYEGSAPVAVSGTNSNARSVIRTISCTDTNNSAADFSNPTTAPTARNTATTSAPCP